jgi:hypothetical protein
MFSRYHPALAVDHIKGILNRHAPPIVDHNEMLLSRVWIECENGDCRGPDVKTPHLRDRCRPSSIFDSRGRLSCEEIKEL